MLRRLLYGVAALLLLLVIVMAGGIWWLGSGSGLQFAVARLQDSIRAGGGDLRIEGATGSLHRSVRIERFEWRADGMQATGTGLVAGWSLPALLQRRLLVTELAADSLEVRLASPEPQPEPAEPATMPGVLALPLDLAVQRLAVGELRVVPGSAPGEPVSEAVVIRDIGARLAYQDARFTIEELGAVTAYGRLAGARLEMADSPPHRLQAELAVQGDFQQVPFDLNLTAAGDLARLQAALTGKVAEADLRLDAALAPLAPMPLVSADLKLSELDLQRLLPASPRTRIDAQLTLAPLAPGGDWGGDWGGDLQLRNAASGRLAEGRLPLDSLVSKLTVLAAADPAARQLQLRDLQLTLPGLAGPGRADGPSHRLAPSGATAAAAVPGGGRISGTIDVFPGRTITLATVPVPEIQAELAFRAIDVAQFAPQAPATALDGSLKLQRNDFALRLSQSKERMRAILPPAAAGAAGDAEVVVAGRLDEVALRLDEARIRLGESRLQATGTAGLSPPHAIAMKGSVQRLQPGQWLPPDTAIADRWRAGTISGNWSVDGRVGPGLDALLTLAIADSTLAGQPLAADVRTRLVLGTDWSLSRLDKAAIDVRFGPNRLRAGGALGGAADKLAVNAEVPQPELIDARLQGRLSLDGELAGAFDRLQAKVALKGDRISLEQPDGPLQVGSVDVRLSGPAAAVVPPQAALDVALRLKGVAAAGRRIDTLEVLANGTLASHRFSISAAGEGQAAKLNGEGSAVLQGTPSWRARIAALALDGRVPMKLTGPAALRLDGAGLQLDRFDLAIAGGEAALERLTLRWEEPLAFSSRGVVRDLPLMELLKIASGPPAAAGRAARTSKVADPKPTVQERHGLDALAGLRLEGSWNLAGSGAADLTGDARIALREKAGPGGLGLEGDNGVRVVLKAGRLDGSFDLRLPSLAFTHALTQPEFVVDGRLRLAGSVGGTVAAPQWNANLTGEALTVLQRSVGWRLADGVLSARFQGRQFELQTLKLQAGDGSVELRGQARLLDAPRPGSGAARAGAASGAGRASKMPFDGRFELIATRFPVPIGPGQRVALSGSTLLASAADGLSLRGKLKVDQGIIEIQGSSAPTLPDDVTLVYPDQAGRDTSGRQGSGGGQDGTVRTAAAAKNADGDGAQTKSGLRILTELAVDLGDRLRVTGNGIAARLTGSLQVLGTLPDNPQLVGVVNIVDGSYQSYGQNLRIEKGLIRFNGPIDNPSLDLVAKRPFLPVEVGVSVTGTALNPTISLVSKPDMSETDKLAWLVLGTDPSSAPSAAQTLALREAARSLLLRSDGSYKPGIGERLGLDVMNFGYGSDTGPTQGVTESRNPTGLPGGQNSSASAAQQEVVTLGKRIGSRLFVSYEQGVRGLYNLLRIQYTLSQRLSLRAQSGSDNAVDLLYSYSFD